MKGERDEDVRGGGWEIEEKKVRGREGGREWGKGVRRKELTYA